MARLYKHGIERLRVRQNMPDKTDELGTLTDRSTTRAYMSDGKVMEKYQVRFHDNANACGSTSWLHDWGWKVIGKYGTKVTIESARAHYIANGWEVVYGGLT